MSTRRVCVGSIEFGNDKPFVLVGGVNVLESEQFAVDVASHYQEVCTELKIPLVFKIENQKDKIDPTEHVGIPWHAFPEP